MASSDASITPSYKHKRYISNNLPGNQGVVWIACVLAARLEVGVAPASSRSEHDGGSYQREDDCCEPPRSGRPERSQAAVWDTARHSSSQDVVGWAVARASSSSQVMPSRVGNA